MGRYVTGDWEWKFAFGDQSSSFGDVLETICDELDETYLSRYISTNNSGEILELVLVNHNELIQGIMDFIGSDFIRKTEDEMNEWCKMKTKFGDEYWDKLMMTKFLEFIQDKGADMETFNFHVEY